MEKTYQNFCQSCGMPMDDCPELYAKNADGTTNHDYCEYCYKDGALAPCTMEQMIDFCTPHVVQANPGMTEAQAKDMMKQFYPTLKRWKKD